MLVHGIRLAGERELADLHVRALHADDAQVSRDLVATFDVDNVAGNKELGNPAYFSRFTCSKRRIINTSAFVPNARSGRRRSPLPRQHFASRCLLGTQHADNI